MIMFPLQAVGQMGNPQVSGNSNARDSRPWLCKEGGTSLQEACLFKQFMVNSALAMLAPNIPPVSAR